MSDNAMIIPPKPGALAAMNLPPADEFSGGIAGGLPLPVMSIRGSKWSLRKDGQEVPLKKLELDVIFVAARPNVSKRFYEVGYVSGSTDAPTCASADGVTPDVAGPVSERCATCPKNAWGSRLSPSGKQSKACSDYKRVLVYVVTDGLGDAMGMPAVLDFPATSLKKPQGTNTPDLFLREYLHLLQSHDLDPRGVVTRLGFTSAEYPQITLRFARHAQPEEVQTVVAMRESDEAQEALAGGAVEGPGKIQEVASVAEVVPLAQPAPSPAAPAPSAAAQVTPDAGAPSAAASPSEGADDEEAALAEIRKLLGG